MMLQLDPHHQGTGGDDLFARPRITQRWIPRFLCGHNRWKVYSGKWKEDRPRRIIYLHEPAVPTGENISIIGSSDWENYTLQVNLSILTNSTQPPEGGAILYFHFRNMRNYYSLHVCLFKQRIEIIKRSKGVWSTLAGQDYALTVNKGHWVRIHTQSGRHQIQIDQNERIEILDHEVAKGSVGIGTKYCDVEFRHASVSAPGKAQWPCS